MVLRILASLILLWSVLFMPFWFSAVLALAGIIYFPIYIEAVALMLLSDLLFGTRVAQFSGMLYIAFITAAIFLVIAELIKKKLKFYS